jgi:predicted O-linked N-acetylglucosamine transferase (SPINDLY family)
MRSLRSFIRTRRMCEWDDFIGRPGFARGQMGSLQDAPLPPFVMLAEPGFSAAEQHICSENWMRARLAAAVPERVRLDFRFAAPRQSAAKLRIGYLSNDFQEHATAHLLIEALEAQDHARFDLHAYSYGGSDGGGMRARLSRAFDRFNDVTALSDAEAAQMIFHDEIDILVDLKGFTRETRTSILALRPAPIQVNFLGYPGTLGPGLCDYIITDAFCTPPESAAHFSESFAYLPHSYQPHGRGGPVAVAPLRAVAGLPAEGFVFCCFNQAFKFTPEVFDIWCRLLRDVPNSVLWLLAAREAEGNLRNEAWARGVDGARLIFAPDLPQAEHLGRLQLADLVLDTAPYGAHTTASDALFAGVPIVTRPGATFPSRVAGSLLRAVGLPELIVEDRDDYFNLAFDLAGDPTRLGGLRQTLAGARGNAPLFDVKAYTIALEALYDRMWARYKAGLPPAAV